MRIQDEILTVAKEEVDRRRVGKTISSKTKSEHGCASISRIAENRSRWKNCVVQSSVVPNDRAKSRDSLD